MGFGIGGFGSMGFGSTVFEGRAFSFSPVQVPQDGGFLVTFTTGLDEGVYRAHFGPNLSTSDPLCYSGVQGQGPNIEVSATGAELWVPSNPLGTSGFFFVRQSGSGDATISTGPLIAVVPFPLRREILNFRTAFPRQWRLGYRAVEDVAPQT